MELAGQQGMLFAHQLPAPEGPQTAQARQAILCDLLAGKTTGLPPVTAPDWAPHDPSLDECQRQAITRALGTPDIALLLGYPGTGKSRIVAELLRQAVARGHRILFLAPSGPALDRVLERLAGDLDLSILRCVCPEENLSDLSAPVLGMTLSERLRLYQRTLGEATQAVEAGQARLSARQREGTLWQQLADLLTEEERLRLQLADVEKQRQTLTETIEREMDDPQTTSPLRSRWEEAQRQGGSDLTSQEAHLDHLQKEIDQLTSEQKQRDAERQQLMPLVEAKQSHRWWTGAWWRATVQGNSQTRLEEIASKSQVAEQQLQTLGAEHEKLSAERAQVQGCLQQRRQELIDAERARRLLVLDTKQPGLEQRLRTSDQRWQEVCRQLTPPPAERTVAAVAAAKQTWTEQGTAEERELALRREWLRSLEQAWPGLPAELASRARIVAATTGLAVERAGAADFDLLVLEEAHRVSEAELLSLSRLARRWVLVGEPPAEVPLPPPPRKPSATRSRSAGPALPFARLWNTLHTDPRRLPTRWSLTTDRLVARLRPVSSEQEPHLQREAVFDRPEIEVAIVTGPEQEPQLAEVTFPPTTALSEAKEYIYRELQELAVQPLGPTLRWRQGETTLTLEFGEPGEGDASVTLENGIRERLTQRACQTTGTTWTTWALEFDCTAGWDQARAEKWAEDRLGLTDRGRTAVLTRCYRARPLLTRFLSGYLFAGVCQPIRESLPAILNDLPAVEFVPVPAHGRGEGRRSADAEPRWHGGGSAAVAVRPRTVRGGAGLEVDLSDPRRPEAIPSDLRNCLPHRGVVNYPEARAIVGMLETLVADHDFLAASTEWQHERSPGCATRCCELQGKGRGPTVAVMSLFPSQVELLRLLIQRSTVLSNSTVRIEVGLPTAIAQRECLVALVGLTRSHASRAVPFSEHPRDLVLALTRATARLVLFGDSGTLTRRSQWFGSLDHLDETTGPLEQALIGDLLAHLPEQEVPVSSRSPHNAAEARPSLNAAEASRARESSSV